MTRETEITFEEILAEIFQKMLKKTPLFLIYRKLSKYQVGWNQDILNQSVKLLKEENKGIIFQAVRYDFKYI